MTETIKWWQSKTILGSVVAVLSGVGAIVGLNLDASLQSQLVDLIIGAGSVIGGVVAIYGRVTAKKTIA